MVGRDKYRFWQGHHQFHASSAEFWFEYESHNFYACLVDQPGTLAHSILAGKADLPVYEKDLRIVGVLVCPIISPPPWPALPEPEDDAEDCSKELSHIPLVSVDESLHFTKPVTYNSEIDALLKCQGSSHIV